MLCIATPTGNIPEASEIQIPPIFQTCSMVVLMVSTVEGFQFIYQTCIDTAGLWTHASARVLQWFMFNSWLPPLNWDGETVPTTASPFNHCMLASPTTSCFSSNTPTKWLVIFACTIFCETDQNSGFRNFSSFNF